MIVPTTQLGEPTGAFLVYLQDKNGLFHYDSYGNSNSFHVKQVAEKLEAFLGRKGNKLAFVEEKALLNKNSCDCAVYVICNTEACVRTSLDDSQNHYCSYSLLHTSSRIEKNGKISLPDLPKFSCWNIVDFGSLLFLPVPMYWMAVVSVSEGRCLGEEIFGCLLSPERMLSSAFS